MSTGWRISFAFSKLKKIRENAPRTAAPPTTFAPPKQATFAPATRAPAAKAVPTFPPRTAAPPPPLAASTRVPPTGSPPTDAPTQAPVKPAPATVNKEEISTVVHVASIGVSPTAGKLAVLKNLNCQVEDIDLVDAEPLDWELHPLGLPLGSTKQRYFAGAVVYNCVLVLFLIALQLLASVYFRFRDGHSFFEAGASVRYPSLAFVPLMFLYQGTTLAATNLVYRPSNGDALTTTIGGLALLACAWLPFSLYWYLLRPFVFAARVIDDPVLQRIDGVNRNYVAPSNVALQSTDSTSSSNSPRTVHLVEESPPTRPFPDPLGSPLSDRDSLPFPLPPVTGMPLAALVPPKEGRERTSPPRRKSSAFSVKKQAAAAVHSHGVLDHSPRHFAAGGRFGFPAAHDNSPVLSEMPLGSQARARSIITATTKRTSTQSVTRQRPASTHPRLDLGTPSDAAPLFHPPPNEQPPRHDTFHVPAASERPGSSRHNSKESTAPSLQLLQASMRQGAARRAYCLVFGVRVWATTRPRANPLFVEKFGVFFEQYRETKQLFVVVELTSILLLSLVSGLRPGSPATCHIRNALIVTILLAFMSVLILTRPYMAPLDNIISILLASMIALAVLLMSTAIALAAERPAATEVLFSISTGLLVVSAVVLMVKALIDFVILLADMLSNRKSRARKAALACEVKPRTASTQYSGTPGNVHLLGSPDTQPLPSPNSALLSFSGDPFGSFLSGGSDDGVPLPLAAINSNSEQRPRRSNPLAKKMSCI
ncbi:hypothetical protein DIPPA_14038 [Diplonema papillatum]|nr:hypothetical protein DIPPA_14038 [Diplonema papillatum]